MRFKSILSKLSKMSVFNNSGMQKSIQLRSIYSFTRSKNLDLLINKATSLKNEINSKQHLVDSSLRAAIQQKMKCLWTYHSNAIEGNRLSLGDTIFFLQEGITVSGKPLKDFLDAKNHADAIDFMYEVVTDKRPINEHFIKYVNHILLTGVTSTPAITTDGKSVQKKADPGQYKTLTNHVLQMDGTIHRYVEPYLVPHEMHDLIEWINKNIKIEHPIITASIAHYNMVRIHPFDDGNGRGARILMNLIFIKEHYSSAIIKIEDRKRYLENLNKADHGEINPLIELVAESSIQTQEVILAELKQAEIKKDNQITEDSESTNSFKL